MSDQTSRWLPFEGLVVRPGYRGVSFPAENNQSSNPPLLFTPLKIRNVELKNRIVVSPMCQYSSQDGSMNDWHLVHLGGLARGGAGLVFTEATAVHPDGRITPWDAGLWPQDQTGEQLANLTRIVRFIHSQSAKAGIQLAHAGRKASTLPPFFENSRKQLKPEDQHGWLTLGPSPIPWSHNFLTPHELSIAEIHEIIQQFLDSTALAEKAGFDVLELHFAHGYLLSSFLSPVSNKRMDEYGGSWEGRAKLCLELTKAVRSAWSHEKPLFVRLSCTDWVEGGWTIDDTVKLSAQLASVGADLIDCSSGGNAFNQKIPDKPGFQVPFSEAVRKNVRVLTGAVGRITTAQQAEAILQSNQADLIFIAREFLRTPHWPLYAAHELGHDIQWPLQYERAKL